MSISKLALLTLLAVGTSSAARAQEHGRLASLAFLTGTWIGRTEGANPAVHVEVRYFWGPTGQLLHFETHDLSGAQRALLYEGYVQCDPKETVCHQVNIKPTGELNRSDVKPDSTGFLAVGTGTRSVVKRIGSDSFEWILNANVNGEWKVIMTVVHRRVDAKNKQ